jgi:glucokinase
MHDGQERKRAMTDTGKILVGDIGGTNARFAVVDVAASPWTIASAMEVEGQFADFAGALRAYLQRAGIAKAPSFISLAVAGPVTAGAVNFTNRQWRLSETELRRAGFAHALLVNDFAALAFSVTALPPRDLHTIGPELAGLEGEPLSVIGAGTGFGAALLARFRGRAVPVATEGGHISFAPTDEKEIDVLHVLTRRFGQVSVERVLSGPGLERLHGAIAKINGHRSMALSAADIVAQADRDPDCHEAVEMFCAIYGAVAGDFALAHGARGGVYLAGGIAQKIEPLLAASSFRARFEAKGRMSDYVKAIPTRLIVSADAAFLGAARASLEFRS